MTAPTSHRTRRRVLVAGYMLRLPLAGNVFAYFHYVLGLRRLGFDVAYVEESGWPGSCYDPRTQMSGDDPTPGIELVRQLLAEHGIDDCPICFVNRESGRTWGLGREALDELVSSTDVLLNVGGICWLDNFATIPRRVLIDMDPLFTQVGGFGGTLLDLHHVHASYGANIGKPGCTVPTAGVDWIATVPPVVCDLWETDAPPAFDARLTTVANWDAYGGVTHDGVHYGQKGEEFAKLIDVPRMAGERLEIALSGGGDVIPQLEMNGWTVRDGGQVSASTAGYQAYVRSSFGEFSAAKNAYVRTRSGWFSDRTVCYLAAGRPVVVQETGASDWLRAPAGVLTFNTPLEAADRIRQVRADHARHASAARALARTVFAHDVVLPRLLEAAGVQAPRPSASHR